MKKSFMILAVLAMSALAMVSCKKDKDTDNGEKITIYATMDSPTTGGGRTHLGPTTNNFTPTYWSTYDEVAVFSGSQMKEFELTGGENTSDATFAGEAPATNSAYCAFYPYSGSANLSATQSGSAYTVTYALPYCQTYRAPVNGNPTFDDRDCPMIAYSTDGQNYQFKNMMGVLKLDLKGTGTVSYIVLKDNNTSAKLRGEATVTVSAVGATPSVTSDCITPVGDSGNKNELKLTCGTGVELNKNTATSFYFVVPVGTLGTNGFTVDVYNADGYSYHIDKSSVSGNIIQRSIISTLAVDGVKLPLSGSIAGKFTINAAGTQVYFSKGNMWYGNGTFQFEDNQYDAASSWNINHISHFLWSPKLSEAISTEYSAQHGSLSGTMDDVFFTNQPDFVVNGQTGWRTLTGGEAENDAEWNYLINIRTMTNDKPRYSYSEDGIAVGETTCHGMFIYPDDYNGTEVGTDETTDSWDKINALGIVFLPCAGTRSQGTINSFGSHGSYVTSSPNDVTHAWICAFYGQYIGPDYTCPRASGSSVRLVHIVED